MLSTFLLCAFAVYAVSLFILRLGLGRPATRRNEGRPFVSVIVAARDEEARLPPLLADLSAQTYTRFEAIFVDDRSTDGTAALISARAEGDPRIKLVRQQRVPVGDSPKKSALQLGIGESRGELLLLTDADCRVLPTWIETIVRYFEPGVAMVLGASELMVSERSSFFERLQSFEFMTLVGNMAASANLKTPLGASGHNLALRRKVFDAVGGYTSVMHRIAGDDMLMLQLVRGRPDLGRVVYADDPRARNRTNAEPTWGRFRSQRARWASSGTHHFRRDPLFMTYAIGSLAVNMAVLFGWMWAWVGWTIWGVWFALVAGKFAADLFFYAAVARRFGRARSLVYLPCWFIAQPIYLLLMAYWGQRGHFTWKP